MKSTHFLWLGAILLITLACDRAKPVERAAWPPVTRESKPWTRWWWMGSAVDSLNISGLMDQYARAGFGGVEITPIYSVRDQDEKEIRFLSPRWMQMLEFTVQEAERVEMGVDMNLGTGWPFGGPMITRDFAAGKLVVIHHEIEDGAAPVEPMVILDPARRAEGLEVEAIVAYGQNGQILQLQGLLDQEGNLQWQPEIGKWDLYVSCCGKTGQLVKRAAPGGEGYSLDHFSREGVELYLDHFDRALPDHSGVRAFFNDSYEVYSASWTPGLFEEFQERRGYDLRDHIRELTSDENPEQAARVKCDYRQTLSELLLEHFTEPWTQWAHRKNGLTRNQAHGSPANLLDLYAAVDIPECETYGHTRYAIDGLRQDSSDRTNVEPDPFMLKLATSAAHISGKRLISNETFTWLGEHFRVPLSQCKPEAEEAFLAGINHIFYHGTTYSPREDSWPGWLFYASTNFAPSNSFWPHLAGLNNYVTRCQSMLQSGQPENELLVYWPIYDTWSDPGGLEKQLSVHNIESWLDFPGIKEMTASGYTFDFISDRWLGECSVSGGRIRTSPESLPYKALIVPRCIHMPTETITGILEMARNGATVIFEQLPMDVPGFLEFETRRATLTSLLDEVTFMETGEGISESKVGNGSILQSPNLERALARAGIKPERINDFGLKYARRTLEDGKIYFLVNHSSEAIDTLLPINDPARAVEIMDPQSGAHGLAGIVTQDEEILIRVQLASGEALFLRTFHGKPPRSGTWEYFIPKGPPMEIAGNWKLSFSGGGPFIPADRVLGYPVVWTGAGDSITDNYSGMGVYEATFEMEEPAADQYLLDLGTVYESARAWLNGEELGILFSNPFSIKTGGALKAGKNELRIEVANLMANRIRYLELKGIPWKKFNDINFVNIQYEPFDASSWEPMKSGLEGPVRLIPMMKD